MPNPELLLHINRRWFQQILAGTKTVEYRTRKPYWDARLSHHDFRYVTFVNGYAPHSPRASFNLTLIRRTRRYYALHIGSQVW